MRACSDSDMFKGVSIISSRSKEQGTRARCTSWPCMSDSTDYLMAHAHKTIMEARGLLRGSAKMNLRHIGGIYHLLAKQGAYSNISFIEDYRAAKWPRNMCGKVRNSISSTTFGLLEGNTPAGRSHIRAASARQTRHRSKRFCIRCRENDRLLTSALAPPLAVVFFI